MGESEEGSAGLDVKAFPAAMAADSREFFRAGLDFGEELVGDFIGTGGRGMIGKQVSVSDSLFVFRQVRNDGLKSQATEMLA